MNRNTDMGPAPGLLGRKPENNAKRVVTVTGRQDSTDFWPDGGTGVNNVSYPAVGAQVRKSPIIGPMTGLSPSENLWR